MHRFAASASVAAAALGTVILPAALPAQAAENDCAPGQVCVWSQSDYAGQIQEVQGRLGHCYQPKAAWANGTQSRIGSLSNKHRFQVELYDNQSCAGQPYAIILPGHDAPQVADRTKSLRMTPVCAPGKVCFYEKADYSGWSWKVAPRQASVCYNAELGSRAARSAYNTTNREVTVHFTKGSCQGVGNTLSSGEFARFNESVHQVAR